MKIDLIERYHQAQKRLFLLDYDGTLVEHTSDPDKAILPEATAEILEKLARQKQNKIVIASGRGYTDIDAMVKSLPVDIIADHGAMIREKGVWNLKCRDTGSWKKDISFIMRGMVEECPDSFIEEKKFSVAWHYRNLDPLRGFIFSRELIRTLWGPAETNGLKIFDGNKVVEILPKEIGKGNAAADFLNTASYDYILCIGDDKTDEDMFSVLSGMPEAFTVKVGYGHTLARHKLDDVSDVMVLLMYLSHEV